MQGILHNWSDEECVKILKKCHNAIAEKNGTVLIVDSLLEQDDNNISENSQIISDLTATTVLTTEKERTEVEWKKLLKEGGFPHYRIIKFPAKQCIIVAYPI